VTQRGDPFERLPRTLRTRLDAFSARVDELPTDEFQMLGTVPFGGDSDPARERADELARRTGRTGAIEAIDELALDYLSRRYSERFQNPRLPFPLSGRVALQAGGPERARVARSFADALTAIALEDVLEPADVDTLLGPWAELADAAGAR
jgi:hypothetical protein